MTQQSNTPPAKGTIFYDKKGVARNSEGQAVDKEGNVIPEPIDTKGDESTNASPKLENKMVFPKEFPRTVYLRRVATIPKLPGQDLDEAKQKIGSGWKGSSVLRGLTFAEEHKYLKDIIGLSTDSPNWETATKSYWANISKEVPPKDGVQLEVGLRYKTKEDYEHDQISGVRDTNGTLIDHKGIPINVSDYILWRYCLLYSRVANTPEDIGKSPKIEFYLFNKDKEIANKKTLLNSKRKAIQLMYKRLGERDWVDYILTVLIAQDKSFTKNVRDLSTMEEDEKDILLDEYVASSPDKFLALAEDKNLQIRSFIELCIVAGKLTRIPNTDTINMDGTLLGNSTIEAIAFLNNPKNNQTLQTLKAQVKHTT